MEEIQKIDIDYLKNEHKSFVCNRCNFNSNDDDNIRKHLSNHVLNNPVQEEDQQTHKKHNWRDDFDDFGHYIGPDSESESEEEDST